MCISTWNNKPRLPVIFRYGSDYHDDSAADVETVHLIRGLKFVGIGTFNLIDVLMFMRTLVLINTGY